MFNKYDWKLDDTFINIDEIKKTAEDDKCLIYNEHDGIPLEEEFRPDLIAWNLYRDVSMAEYLAIINDIVDIPEGFYRGRKIKVLKEEYKDLVC